MTSTEMAALSRRASAVTPAGVHSNVRLERATTFIARGKGAWIWDEQGRDYVDHLLGQGPAFLGHAHPEVTSVVARAAADGTVFGAQHRLEPEAAERILEAIGFADRVRIGATATECVQAALRVARAATGRRLVLRFAGHYHGWLDAVMRRTPGGPLQAGQAPGSVLDDVVIEWNDLAAVERAFDEAVGGIAAVLTEPLMLNTGGIMPADGFLDGLAEICRRRGALLVFDETITGFRVARGGAAEVFGVVPDLAVYGKALGGGWPVAALAGRAEVMDLFGTGVVHAGTFNASVPACAAVIAALGAAEREDAVGRARAYGAHLMDTLQKLGAETGLPITTRGLPAAFFVTCETGPPPRSAADLDLAAAERYAAVADALVSRGVWVARRGVWYTSSAHDERTLEATIARVRDAFADATGGGR